MNRQIIRIIAALTLSANLFAAETYPDPLLSAVATKESVTKAKEIDAYTFNLFLRLYQPGEEILNGTYPLSQLITVQ